MPGRSAKDYSRKFGVRATSAMQNELGEVAPPYRYIQKYELELRKYLFRLRSYTELTRSLMKDVQSLPASNSYEILKFYYEEIIDDWLSEHIESYNEARTDKQLELLTQIRETYDDIIKNEDAPKETLSESCKELRRKFLLGLSQMCDNSLNMRNYSE